MSGKPPVAHLTEETIVEYRDAFDSFDYSKAGKLSPLDIPILMRKLGLMPSNLEVEEMIEEIYKEKDTAADGITFEQFCCIAARKYNDIYKEADIIEAFRTFDLEEHGYVSSAELRRVLCGMGEKLTDDEFEAMLYQAKMDEDGNVHYETFVRRMMEDMYQDR
ncbi:hypothetical protein T265_00492 [Opisthorchis viverrini]|uniref:EF-hand domain-containing protein n=1 Tax=Opisthorchis viverrini TaxID=6198 RepID=A0A075A5L5_OPIVI|nr:hypothetical protein T265_00492 [Opisthorchis viverrini]KER33597.1 hypothetical protein T265_00492 [Opisthorchis viverrini]